MQSCMKPLQNCKSSWTRTLTIVPCRHHRTDTRSLRRKVCESHLARRLVGKRAIRDRLWRSPRSQIRSFRICPPLAQAAPSTSNATKQLVRLRHAVWRMLSFRSAYSAWSKGSILPTSRSRTEGYISWEYKSAHPESLTMLLTLIPMRRSWGGKGCLFWPYLFGVSDGLDTVIERAVTHPAAEWVFLRTGGDGDRLVSKYRLSEGQTCLIVTRRRGAMEIYHSGIH